MNNQVLVFWKWGTNPRWRKGLRYPGDVLFLPSALWVNANRLKVKLIHVCCCVVVSMSNIEAQTWLPFFVFAKQGNFKIRSSCAWLMVRSFYELDRLCLSQSQGIFDEGGSIRYWGSASVCGLNLQEKQPEPIWSNTLTLCNMQRQSVACWGRKDGIVLISIPAGTPSGLIGFLYLVFSN